MNFNARNKPVAAADTTGTGVKCSYQCPLTSGGAAIASASWRLNSGTPTVQLRLTSYRTGVTAVIDAVTASKFWDMPCYLEPGDTLDFNVSAGSAGNSDFNISAAEIP